MDALANATITPTSDALFSTAGTPSVKLLAPAIVLLLASAAFLFRPDGDFSAANGGDKIRLAPYRLPFVGHIAAVISGIDALLRASR